MRLRVNRAASDRTGEADRWLVRAIIAGERELRKLTPLRQGRYRKSVTAFGRIWRVRDMTIVS